MNKIKFIILLIGFFAACTVMAYAQRSDSTLQNSYPMKFIKGHGLYGLKGPQTDSSLLKNAYRYELDSLYDLHDTLSFKSKEWQLYADNIVRFIRVVNQKKQPTFAQFLHLFHDPQADHGDEAEIVEVPYGGDDQMGLDTVHAKLKHPTKYPSGVLTLIRKYNFLYHLQNIKAYYIWPNLKVQTIIAPFMRDYYMYVVTEDQKGQFHKLVFEMKPIRIYNEKEQNGLIYAIYDGEGRVLINVAIYKYEQDWKVGHK